MKTHTNGFKYYIKEFGRQIDCKIIFTIDGTTTTLTNEEINSVQPITQGDLLKSVMKELYIDSNVEIPKDTEIQFQFGVLNYNNDTFEYVDYGKYYVTKSEYQEDTMSYAITCYDKMINSMVDYEEVIMTYPTTVREYINQLCQNIGITFANANDKFANYDKEIPSDLYKKLDYTYRDVLDELAQVTASTICINEDNQLEIRYVHNVGEYLTATGTSFQIPNCDDGNDLKVSLEGDTSQASDPTPDSPVDVNVVSGDNTIKVGNKNLFKPFNYSRTNNGIDFTYSEDGYINVNNTSTGNALSMNTASSTPYQITLQTGTYTISGDTTDIRLEVVNSSGTSLCITNVSRIFTLNETTNVFVRANIGRGRTFDNFKIYPQLEKGSTATDYEEHKEQNYLISLGNIELCKIGDYQDDIFESSGKNLFDIDNSYSSRHTCNITRTINVLTQTNTGTYSRTEWEIDNLVIGQEYTLSYKFINNSGSSIQPRIYDSENTNIIKNGTATTDTSGISTTTFTANETTHFIRLYSNTANTSNSYTVTFYNIQLEKGTSSSAYEPFGNGDWYIKKEIGKYQATGNETITYDTTYNYCRLSGITFGNDGLQNANQYSTHFIPITPWATFRNGTTLNGMYPLTTNPTSNYQICIRNTSLLNQTDYTNWVTTNKPVFYYQLNTPTYTKITNENYPELLGQLESVRLLSGLNNVSVMANNLASPISVTYLSQRDTIDEEYLSEDNVKFGKKIGKINSIVLSRSAESDNVYLRDEESVTQNGLYEIKIVDNQIMNFNNRADFLPDILAKLDNLEYYSMDVLSTGICYYDVCDKYNVSVNDKKYICVLMNDETNINQGVEENIYVNDPEKSVTEYKYADTTDKKINQAYIIVDKQNASIQALTERTSNISSSEQSHYQDMLSRIDEKASISDIDTVTTRINTVQEDTYRKTEIKTILEGVNEFGVKVSYVSTNSATFNESGMTYAKSDAKTSSTINESGLTVNDDSNNELLFAGYDAVLEEAMVRVANLYLTRFLGLDDWRIEIVNDSTNGKGLGFFYIG